MTPRRITVFCVTLAAVATVAGCSGNPAPGPTGTPSASRSAYATPNPTAAFHAQPLPSGSPGPYPVALPSPGSVQRTDATAVAQAAVITMWSMNTKTDTSQYQAELRAGWLLTPVYLAQLRLYPPVGSPGAWWTTWYQHGAYSTVDAIRHANDQPPDTATIADRSFSITATPHGAAGWSAAPITATVFVQLVRPGPGQPWAVAATSTSN